MGNQDENKDVGSTKIETKSTDAEKESAAGSAELTFQELEDRIAPLTVRKAGGDQH